MLILKGEVRDVKTTISEKNGKTYNRLLIDIGTAYPARLNWNSDKPVPKLKQVIEVPVRAFGKFWDDEKKKYFTANVDFGLFDDK